MARKKSHEAESALGCPPRGLDELRAEIDKIDLQMLSLVNARAALAIEIGRVKDSTGQEVFSPQREDQILDRMARENPGPLPERAVRAMYREIMSGSRALQKPLRVAFLGPEYSFSHLAALEKFGSSVEFLPVANISGVFETVNRRQADLGMVPLENSTDGRVADTLDMFIRLPLRICAEVPLRIHHNLLAQGRLSEIRRVYSKPQALSQCRHWLGSNLPKAALVEVASTTIAVEHAQAEPETAAIASRQAGIAYGLPLVCADIEDRRDNVTRFAVIGLQHGTRTGNDKTTLMFQIQDEPGALCDVLAIVKTNKVNMTWIESFPAGTTQPNEYLFFVDLLGHCEDEPLARTIADLGNQCQRLVVLGSFPRGAASD